MTSSIMLRRSARGFTLTEMLIALTITGVALACSLGLFLTGLRAMGRDTQRLITNASLRYFIAQVSKETLDSTEFYVFPTYESLDGNVDLSADASPLEEDAFETSLATGDCMVLATREAAADATSNVVSFRIYYRVRKASDEASKISPVRYYEKVVPAADASKTLTQLLNAVNLKETPSITGSRQIVALTRGRPISGSDGKCYPIFSTELATASPTNNSVSINVEVINGTKTTNMLSSSSFNYTISPRK